MRAATAQQPRGGGSAGSNQGQGPSGHHANARSFSNAHSRKGSAASSASSSAGTGAGTGGAGTGTGAAATTSSQGAITAATGPQAANSGDSSSSSSTMSLSSVIGSQIRLTLNTGARDKERPVVEGQLWCYDPGFGSLVLMTPSSAPNSPGPPATNNYRIVRLSSIASVTVIQPAESETAASLVNLQLKAVDINRLQEREAEGVKEEAKRIANEPPPGVSELGKSLYEALGKTLPVRWANKTIVVMDEVLVEPPYASNDQCIKSNNAQRRERVLKVIVGETAKLQRAQPEILSQ